VNVISQKMVRYVQRCCLVSSGLTYGAYGHSVAGSPGALFQALVEHEVPDREFGVVDVVVKHIEPGLIQAVVLSELGVEALEGIEILSLVGVIERLAEIEVPQVGTHGRTDGQSQCQDESDEQVLRSHHWLPFPERDRSLARIGSGQRQPHQLGLHVLAEGKPLRAAEVRATLELAVDNDLELVIPGRDRKSTRLNSSHGSIS